MRRKLLGLATAIILAPLAIPAAHAMNSACQNVQFSDAVLQRLSHIREDCLDVITRDGQQYALVRTGTYEATDLPLAHSEASLFNATKFRPGITAAAIILLLIGATLARLKGLAPHE